MTPKERKVNVTVISIVCGSIGGIIGVVMSLHQQNQGFLPNAALGHSIRTAFIAVAGMGVGIVLASLVLPKARVTCPKCQDPRAIPAGKEFVSGRSTPNKCARCGHEWGWQGEDRIAFDTIDPREKRARPPFSSVSPPLLTRMLASVLPFKQKRLIGAARKGDASLISALLQAGIHPDARNKAGETPLMAASANGHTEAVAALLAGGADPNIQNEGAFHWMYNTALAQAASNGHRDVVETLVRAGADPDARNTIRYGPLVNRHTIQTTALMEATIEGNVEAVAALVEAGADLNLPVLFNGRACDGATARYFVSKVVVCEIPIPRNAPDFGFKLVGAPPAIRKFWRDSRRFTAKVKALCDLCDLRSIPDFQLPIEADEKEAYNRIAVIFASQDSFANFTRARQNGDIRAAMIALLETLRSNPKHALACRYLNMAFCPKCANYVNWRGLSEVAMDRFLIGRCPKCEKPISFHDVDIQEN